MLLKSLDCPVSKFVNSDTCPRPTTESYSAGLALMVFQYWLIEPSGAHARAAAAAEGILCGAQPLRHEPVRVLRAATDRGPHLTAAVWLGRLIGTQPIAIRY
jgi:hypothetical protein